MKLLISCFLFVTLLQLCVTQWIFAERFGSLNCNTTIGVGSLFQRAGVCYKQNGKYYKSACNDGPKSIEQWECTEADCNCPSTVKTLDSKGCLTTAGLKFGGTFGGAPTCVEGPSSTSMSTIYFSQTDTKCENPIYIQTTSNILCQSTGGFFQKYSCNETNFITQLYSDSSCKNIVSTTLTPTKVCNAGNGLYTMNQCGFSAGWSFSLSMVIALFAFMVMFFQ